MHLHRGDGEPQFRLWIASCSDWRPKSWHEAPPQAIALELVEEALYSADNAVRFLEGFNGQMLETPQPGLWAVAVPVTLRYEGDAQVGAAVRGFDFGPWDAQAACGAADEGAGDAAGEGAGLAEPGGRGR